MFCPWILYFDLFPLQYTDLTHQVWRFLVYIFLGHATRNIHGEWEAVEKELTRPVVRKPCIKSCDEPWIGKIDSSYSKFLSIPLILLHKNLCKKVPGKKFLEKNLEIKTLEKSPNFLKSLEKMSLEIKSCVLGSWDFFPKIVWGPPIKCQEIRSQEKKSWRK